MSFLMKPVIIFWGDLNKYLMNHPSSKSYLMYIIYNSNCIIENCPKLSKNQYIKDSEKEIPDIHTR